MPEEESPLVCRSGPVILTPPDCPLRTVIHWHQTSSSEALNSTGGDVSTDRQMSMPGGSVRSLPFKSKKDIWPYALARPGSLGLLVLSSVSALQVQCMV